MPTPRFQDASPLDRLYFAADDACAPSLPGAAAIAAVELNGPLDPHRLQHAFTVLQRRYPATAARRATHPLTGLPRWRLPTQSTPASRLLTQTLPDASHVHTACEAIFNRRIETRAEAPLQLHLLRSPSQDTVVLRWTHALADGPGAFALLETLNETYTAHPDAHQVTSLGDEQRNPYRELAPQSLRLWRDRLTPRAADFASRGDRCALWAAPRNPQFGRLRLIIRPIPHDQWRTVEARAAALNAPRRLSDWLRACAARTVADWADAGPDAAVTLTALTDHRRRLAAPTPVCWNLITAAPLYLSVRQARDRVASAIALRRQITAHRRHHTAEQQIARLALITRTPTAYVARIIRSRLTDPPTPGLRYGAGVAPCAPLGLLPLWSPPRDQFCGVSFNGMWACRAPVPVIGWCVEANLTPHGAALVGVCYDQVVSPVRLADWLDDYVAWLRAPL